MSSTWRKYFSIRRCIVVMLLMAAASGATGLLTFLIFDSVYPRLSLAAGLVCEVGMGYSIWWLGKNAIHDYIDNTNLRIQGR